MASHYPDQHTERRRQLVHDAQQAHREAIARSRQEQAQTGAILETATYGLGILLFVLLIVLIFTTTGCGGGSPTGPSSSPQPSPAKVCTIVHHDEQITATTIFIAGKPTIQYTIVPAYDEQVCK